MSENIPYSPIVGHDVESTMDNIADVVSLLQSLYEWRSEPNNFELTDHAKGTALILNCISYALIDVRQELKNIASD